MRSWQSNTRVTNLYKYIAKWNNILSKTRISILNVCCALVIIRDFEVVTSQIILHNIIVIYAGVQKTTGIVSAMKLNCSMKLNVSGDSYSMHVESVSKYKWE